MAVPVAALAKLAAAALSDEDTRQKAGLDRGGDLFTVDPDAGADLLSALRQRGA